MKRWGLMILVAALALQGMAKPYSRELKNFFYVEVGAGYEALLTSGNELKPGEGAAAQLGIGYRYANHMLLLQVGLEGQFGYMTNRANSFQDSTRMEEEGLEIIRYGEMNQRREIYRTANLAIPVAAGCDFGPIYFLAGLKPAMSVWGDAKAEAHVQGWSEYYGVLPGTQTNVYVQSNGGAEEQMKWKMQLYAHLEVGGPIRLPNESWQNPLRLKWSIWADCGILNAYSPTQNQTTATMQAPYTDATIYPTVKYNSDITSRQLAVGAKLTLLIGMRPQKTCVCLGY